MTFETEDWLQGSSVDKIIGSEDIVYCRISIPFKDEVNHIIYEGFGPCRIKIDRVTLRHHGLWTVVYAVKGSVVTQGGVFNVRVIPVGMYRF